MARKHDLRRASYIADANIETYRPEDDGRNSAGERIRYVPLRLIHPSRHQARRVTDPEADALLADDIDAHGLTHVPLLRPHPERAGEYEIVAGHRRVAALRRLATEGRGVDVLRGTEEVPEERRIPVIIREIDDLAAHATTVAENFVRESLRPWEQAVALNELRCALERQDERASVRGVASRLDVSHQTVAPYLRVARALTPEVLEAAGLRRANDAAGGLVVDERPLCVLSLAALERAARRKEPSERARVLRAEIGKAQQSAQRKSVDVARAADTGRDTAIDAKQRGLQINIRRPLGSLTSGQARRYLEKVIPAVGALLEVACLEEKRWCVALASGQTLVLQVAPAAGATGGDETDP